MTFLRRYEQHIRTPKWHPIEAPADFVERAYAAGLDPGSGDVRLYNENGYVAAVLTGKFSGVLAEVRAIGYNDARACERLLRRLEELKEMRDGGKAEGGLPGPL